MSLLGNERKTTSHPKRLVWTALLAGAVTAPLISQGPERTSQDLDTVEFHQTPGLREFSGRLIARPLQRGAWIVQGASDAEISRRLAEARRGMASFDLVDYVAQTDEYIFLAPAGETEN